MGCTCAPVIEAEMADWIHIGGTNSGCCGNAAHTYGFHRAANQVPATDYSRRHDAQPPVNMNYACAGDFAHNGNPALRAVHANILARLMHGELPMICEFIGQPWANKPVYYWCRWDGITTLKKYTGSGHDRWSHISWWRSRVNQRAYLYTGHGVTPPAPNVTPARITIPAYPGHELRLGAHETAMRTWQSRMRVRGWVIGVDGIFGPQSLGVVRAFQAEKHLGVDGIIGPKTWGAAWTAPIT